MDKDSSFQSGFTFSGIKPEFRPGFIDQVRAFARIGLVEASRLEACGEAWVKGDRAIASAPAIQVRAPESDV